MVPIHSRVLDIVELSGFLNEHSGLDRAALSFGIFGKRVANDTLVKQGDRIEIYRPLTFDPKESRRRRAAHRKGQKKGRIHPEGVVSENGK